MLLGSNETSLLPIGTGLLAIAEGLADDAAEVVQRVVVRILRDEDIEVGQCLAVPAQPAQSLRPAVARTVPIRLVGEDTAEIVRGQGGLGEGEGDQAALESGLVVLRRSFEQAVEGRQRAGQFARFLVRLGQEPGRVGIARTHPEQMLEIGDRFGPLLLLGEQPAAVDQGFGIVGLGGEPAVHLGQFGGAPRLGLEDFADDSYRPRRGHRTEGVARIRGRGIRRRVPVQPQDRRAGHGSAAGPTPARSFWFVLAMSFVPSGLKTIGVGVTGCKVVSRASSRPVAASASKT